MKKFISFAAFALLATMSLSFVSCSDDDEPALPEVPTTLAEAKAMLIGQWRTPDAFLPTFADEGILEFGKDGRVIRIFKIKKNLPMSPSLKRLDDPYLEYAGQYVGFVEFAYWTISPYTEDPANSVIGLYENKPASDEEDPDEQDAYQNLTKNSFQGSGRTYIRVTKPVKYTLINRSKS